MAPVVLGALGALAFAVPAQAHTQAAAACTITGNADATVNKLGGSGNYTFQGVIGCAGSYDTKDDGYGTAAGPFVATLDATSEGHFTNTVCGTGTAGDTAATATVSVVALDPGGLGDDILAQTDVAYSIKFVSRVGALYWSDDGDSGDLTSVPNLHNGGWDGTEWEPTGGGVIYIEPTTAQNHLHPADPVCTDGFLVEGNVDAVVSGDKP